MSLPQSAIEEAAASLFKAEQESTQIGLLSQRHPNMDLDDAYAIQAALIERKISAGRKIVGWKIGLTSHAMQQALGIDTPDSGALFDDMRFAHEAAVPAGRFIQPRIEAEIAFAMKEDLGGASAGPDDVLDATEYVAPCLEILDTRIVRKDPQTGAMRTVCDTIADNAANAGFVVGSERHEPRAFDLPRVGAIVSRNGEILETGLGAGVLGNPAAALAWLAQRLAPYGQRIEAGQLVLSGSFIRPIECPSGTQIRADFGPFGCANIDFA